MGDLRGKFKCTALDLSLIIDIFARYGNEKPRRTSRDPKREPPCEEVVIPQKMERCAVGLSKLAGFSPPARRWRTSFLRNFTRRAKKGPRYTPFVVPKLQDKPWLDPSTSHERTGKYWRENIAPKGRDQSHQVSLQAWIFYLLRFILTGDLCNAWNVFGCLAAQLSHMGVVLHLGVTEMGRFLLLTILRCALGFNAWRVGGGPQSITQNSLVEKTMR